MRHHQRHRAQLHGQLSSSDWRTLCLRQAIDKVTGPVGEALILTALGLAVVIPSTFGYNALVRGSKSTLARHELLTRPAVAAASLGSVPP